MTSLDGRFLEQKKKKNGLRTGSLCNGFIDIVSHIRAPLVTSAENEIVVMNEN